MHTIQLGSFSVGKNCPLTIICGPCVIEGEEFLLHSAEALQEIFSHHNVQWIFKASYDKANRSSIHSFRGPGLQEGLRMLEKVKNTFGVPVLSDIHTVEEAKAAGSVLDVLQVPAFLCRQTDLIEAVGLYGKAVNVKKGQFLAPWDMKNVVEKLESVGQKNMLLTDRGTSFGYNNLVSDMRSIPIMQKFGYPACFDATHSVQLPGGQGSSSGGQTEFIPTLARASIAAGVNALFIEAHPDPANAKSDASSVMSYEGLKALLKEVEKLYEVMQCLHAAWL